MSKNNNKQTPENNKNQTNSNNCPTSSKNDSEVKIVRDVKNDKSKKN